jgi:hypothetical protein
MKIKVIELKKALETVKPGLSTLEVIEQSTSFAFINGNVVTYNDEISVMHPVALDITGAVKADLLLKYLGKIKTEEVDVEVSETELIVKSGRATSGFAFTPEVTLPLDEELSKKGKWKTLPEEFLEYLKMASYSCAKELSDPKITCVHVNKNYIESTNNFSVSRYTLNTEVPIDPFLLPASSVSVVVSNKPTKITSGKGWVHFKNKENTIVSCRIFEDTFVDIEKVITNAKKGVGISLPDNLKDVLDKALVFVEKQNVLNEEIVVAITKKNIEISCESETGWFKETIRNKSENEFSIRVAPSLLKIIVGKTNKCYYLEKNHLLYFDENNWKYITALKR